MSCTPSAADFYARRIEALDEKRRHLQLRERVVSRARGLTFLVSAGLALYGWRYADHPVPAFAGAACIFALFVALVAYADYLAELLRVTRVRGEINRQQVARRARKWDVVPVPNVDVPERFAQRAIDLDLFGKASLYQLVCNAYTPRGKSVLRDWLLETAAPVDIRQRQQAVAWLADRTELREELALHGRLLAASESGPDGLLAWAEGPSWLDLRPWLKTLVPTLSIGMILLVLLIGLQWIAAEWILLAFALVGVNIVVNVIYVGSVHDLYNQITAGKNEIDHYATLFQRVSDLPGDPPFLGRLRSRIKATSVGFQRSLRRLRRILKLANGRRSALFGVPYLLAQVLVLWDFHVLVLLERWRRQFGSSIRDWLEAVAQLEAVASLATLRHDQPDWAMAEFREDGEPILSTRHMGHPLIPDATRVCNEVTIGPPGTFLLVTGSNMSGKSTLLRALGVNVALAHAGGPVCAQSFSLTTLHVETSMRTRDSLVEGVSYFMAELLRLKHIVDVSQVLSASNQSPMLFLFDEILQGTNSAERHIAVAQVIGHLLKRNAIGAVSTHDLQLAQADGLRDHCQAVHFRESFERSGPTRRMTFDYRLRPGVAPTTNALILLELVGLRAPYGGRSEGAFGL
jgi:hypothetical protein